jgi:hypothetical protein
MFWIFSCGFVLFSAVLLGRYRLEGDVEAQPGRTGCRFRLVSAGGILGIEWNGLPRQGGLFLVVFGKKVKIRGSVSFPKAKTLSASGSRKHRGLSAGMILEILKQSVRLIRSVHVDHAELCGTIGLENPAVTGWAFGMIQSIRYLIPERFIFDVKPDFMNKTVQGKALFRVSFWMPAVIAAVFRTVRAIHRPGGTK